MSKRYVFMMFGYPGSGKSFVAEWLTPHFNAVHLKADEMRLSMFGKDRPDLYTPENKALVNGAIRYAYQQVLRAGNSSVVLDANHNQRSVREVLEKLAHQNGAVPVVVWVKTPQEVAKERIQIRAETTGHVIFDPKIIEKMLSEMQPPGKDEHLITLDGLQPTEEQQASFDKQFKALEFGSFRPTP